MVNSGHAYAVSWFVQQAVEKALKAVYIEQRGMLAPRSHDLERLGREVHVPSTLEPDLMLLNPTFEMVRYPDAASGLPPVDSVTPEAATAHLAAGERIMTWIDNELSSRR